MKPTMTGLNQTAFGAAGSPSGRSTGSSGTRDRAMGISLAGANRLPLMDAVARIRRPPRLGRRPRATVLSVLGELLLTAGVLVLLFVAWQLWIGDLIISAQHNEKGAELSRAWAAAPIPDPPPAAGTAADGTVVYEPP